MAAVVVVRLLDRPDGTSPIIFDRAGALQFVGTSAQVLAALIGFILAVLLFRQQNLESNRQARYQTLRHELARLGELSAMRADNLRVIDVHVADVLSYLGRLTLDEIEAFRSDTIGRLWQDLANRVLQEVAVRSSAVSAADRAYLELVAATIRYVDELLFAFERETVTIKLANDKLREVRRLAVVLAVSLVLGLGLITTDQWRSDLGVPVLAAFTAWLLTNLWILVRSMEQLFAGRSSLVERRD